MAEVFHRYQAAAANLAFALFYPNKLGYEFTELRVGISRKIVQFLKPVRFKAAPDSGHQRENQECGKNYQMDCSLHHVGATGAQSESAHHERHREQRDVLRLQTQDER
jgi:hypothetical protein